MNISEIIYNTGGLEIPILLRYEILTCTQYFFYCP